MFSLPTSKRAGKGCAAAAKRYVEERIPTTILNEEKESSLKEDVEEKILKAARICIELEEKYIDKMFEMGDLENLTAYDLKQFIRKRGNEKLKELGYKGIFKYDKKAAKNLDWFYHLTGGLTHTDFFAIRPTDYSKANEGEDFEDIW